MFIPPESMPCNRPIQTNWTGVSVACIRGERKSLLSWVRMFLGAFFVALPATPPPRKEDFQPPARMAKIEEPKHEHIKVAAYYIWLREGMPRGRDKIHWRMAKDQLVLNEVQTQWR